MTRLILLALAAVGIAGEPSRTWNLRDGRTFDAPLAAADGLRATFAPEEKPAFVVAISQLAQADADFIGNWRADWRRPLILPSRLAPWPVQAAAPAGEVQFRGEDAGVFNYESANFRIVSEVKLPAGTVGDLAKVFEATRAALIAMPLGLHAGGERARYEVSLLRDAESYKSAGGTGGTGGIYVARSRRMLVLLPNIGIEQGESGLRLNYGGNLFVLKHEVTHQLMARWHRGIPLWAWEGIAEVVASLPYAQGQYTLRNPGAGIRDYVLKWRKSKDSRTIKLVPPARLMAMNGEDWKTAVEQQEAYDLYNSAALLTLYFIRQDGGAPFAGYLDELRRGGEPAFAERMHLLRGKSRDSLAAEIIARTAIFFTSREWSRRRRSSCFSPMRTTRSSVRCSSSASQTNKTNCGRATSSAARRRRSSRG